ncbi:MAG: RidA family protein [Candidatus Limnocylindrales bacterium]
MELPPGEFGIPAADPTQASQARPGKGRWVAGEAVLQPDATKPAIGYGRAVKAGGMVYVSSMGPVDPATGLVVGTTVKLQTAQCLGNLKARLEAEGSSLDKVVWANWSLRDPEEFDAFNREWARWFPGDSPIGQCTLMPPQQRRAGFRVSIGVIAEA